MVNYQNAKIYKIINDAMPNMVYYGSTCNTFAKRFNGHKNMFCTSRFLFEYGTPQMILVEKYPCNDKMELNQRERFYIEGNECVNKNIPGRTTKETRKAYIEANKDKIALKQKEYDNSIKEKLSLKHNCECGGKYTINSKVKHKKTQKHLKYLGSL